MIFLTIGTQEPFDRLVRAVDDWCGTRGRADVFGQITERAGYRPRHFPYVGHLPPPDFNDRCRQARFLIAHAGMGSIITALTLGKPIVIMPRRSDFGEQRNDHQLATAGRLGTKPGIHVARSESDVPKMLDQLSGCADQDALPAIGPFAEDRLISALRELIG